jgi:hypothetical protein
VTFKKVLDPNYPINFTQVSKSPFSDDKRSNAILKTPDKQDVRDMKLKKLRELLISLHL